MGEVGAGLGLVARCCGRVSWGEIGEKKPPKLGARNLTQSVQMIEHQQNPFSGLSVAREESENRSPLFEAWLN